jgi:hypothetical protein
MVCVRFACIYTITGSVAHIGSPIYKVTSCNANISRETALAYESAARMAQTCYDVSQHQAARAIYTHNGVRTAALLATDSRPTGLTVNNAQTRSNRPIPSNVPPGLDTRSLVPPELRISTKRRAGSHTVVYYPYTKHSPKHAYFAYLGTLFKCIC